MKEGIINTEAKDDTEDSVYRMYYAFSEGVAKIAGHRILAINRGEKEKKLKVSLNMPDDEIVNYLYKKTITRDNKNTSAILREACDDAYSRLIQPSIDREVRNALTERAEEGAIAVFGKNLTQLLMQPPVAGHVVLGWDPAFRTGCKLAVVDETGRVLDTKVIYPTAPQNKVAEAKVELKKLINKYSMLINNAGYNIRSDEKEDYSKYVSVTNNVNTKIIIFLLLLFIYYSYFHKISYFTIYWKSSSNYITVSLF